MRPPVEWSATTTFYGIPGLIRIRWGRSHGAIRVDAEAAPIRGGPAKRQDFV